MGYELYGVPYSSTGGSDGIAAASQALRECGLIARLAGLAEDRGELSLRLRDPGRGPSGLANEPGLLELIEATEIAVAATLDRGGRALLVGGDCPVLLGALSAIQSREGSCGLLMVDGHEDAYPPLASPTGEGSDSELGMALGLFDSELRPDLVERLPKLDADATALLGPRDGAELAENGVASLSERLLLHNDRRLIDGDARALTAAAVERVRAHSERWWLHLDLDVLSTVALAAIDYPQEGGLSWGKLVEVAETALAEPGCAGLSVVIYNPDLDPDRSHARAIVGFLAEALSFS